MKYILLLLLLFTITSFGQQKNGSIGFIENKGQIMDQNGKPNPAVQFLLNTNGLNVQIKKTGFSYDIYETKKIPVKQRITDKNTFPSSVENNKKVPDYTVEYVFHRIDIDFVNANPNVQFISEEKSTDYDNYYNIPNKPEGVLMVHKFKQITYKNIYPNIDVVFSIPKDTLKAVEYNFVVHPNGKISDIQLKFNGSKTELLDNKIKMNVRFGQMEEILPASWTEDGMRKKTITVNYKKIKNNVYGFNTPNAVNGKTVIIDPVPTRLWGTFYGDQTSIHFTLKPSDISTDSFGNAYVSGSTSASNPSYATSGAYQSSPSSSFLNGIVEKFSPDGNRLWGTYYGGQNYTDISGIKIDSQNNVIITGTTESQTTISTIGSYKPNLNGSNDAFLVKFNNVGIRIWGTYFGGEYQDLGYDIAVDNNDNIYMIGQTTSTTGIAINSNFQTQINIDPNFTNTIDGFLAKFGSGGNLLWSSYVGGENRDDLNDIVVKNNYLIIGGTTRSFNNISTSGVFQELHNTIAHPDGVVYKFSLDGYRIWATYYGGEQIDELYAVEIDNEDNIYLGGQTASNNNITTANSFDSTNTLPYKGFFVKLNSNGQRIWGTYLGQAHVYSIIFKNNSLYLGATNFGFSYPKLTTPCSYRSNQHFERYIAKFSKEADFIWGSYIGGDSSYSPTKIALAPDNNIFASGISGVNNGIADSDSYQSNVLGFYNYFLMKFSEDIVSTPIISSNSPICIGNKLELKASGGTDYLWTGPNNFTSTDQNPIILNATTANSGQYSCTITGTVGCDDTKKTEVYIQNTPLPSANTNQSFCTGTNPSIADIQVTGTQIKWYDAINNSTLLTETTNLQNDKTYYATQTVNNCESERLGIHVSIVNTPSAPIATPTQSFCKNENATLEDIQISGQNIKWYDTNFSVVSLPNTTLLEDNKTYYASQTIGCESNRTPILIRVYNTPLPTGNINQQFCIDENVTISNISISGSNIKWYDEPANGNILTETTLLLDGKTYYATQTLNNCESNRLAITVKIQDTQIPITNSPQTFCIQKNAKISDIVISGQNISWYESASSSILLSEFTLLENGITYYASETINNCESERIPVAIIIQEATTEDCINFVDELPYPKFFTPNNDGHNDTWTIDFAYLKPNTGIQIFDRYGKLLKVLLPDAAWNGQFNNQELPATDYWFIVTRANGQEYKGHFSLKR